MGRGFRVVETFVRMAPEVIDAEVSYGDGTTDTLTGTPNHPFWVDAVRDYVPLGKLEVGTVLHVQGGGEAILVSKTWRQGDFEVFDFEVEGLHNFYVRGEGSDAAGVLVHNSSAFQSIRGVGGSHTEVRALIEGAGDLWELHHLVSASALKKAGFNSDDMPAIAMTVEDHMNTLNWGPGGAGLRAEELRLLNEEGFQAAYDFGVAQIRQQFGSKYDEAIEATTEAYRAAGLIE